jgi:mannose-6-phosphate isomerase-like protein (cupin superfamily)
VSDAAGGFAARPLVGRTLSAGGAGTLVLEEAIDDGSVPGYPVAPLHRHLEEDEAWYVLEGRLVVRVGSDELEIGPGEAVLGPKGLPHTFWNPGSMPARYLLIMGPRTAHLVAALHDGTSRDREAVEALFREHGADLLG